MNTLEKMIIGKWVDIREESKDIHSLNDYFKIPPPPLKLEIKKLSGSVELGIFEYKKNILNSLYRSLESVKYKSFSLDVINKMIDLIRVLLYIVLNQKLLASGLIKISSEKERETISPEDIEINHILKDILARIKENPDLRKKPEIKNILIQFTIYKNERGTLEKLSHSMKNPGDKNSVFYKNFRETFNKIFSSIRKNYAIILKEDARPFIRKNILAGIPGKKLSNIIFNQAREMTTILATLEFVYNEKYKTREILINLYNGKERIMRLLDMEVQYYKGFCKEGDDKALAAVCYGFAKEIVLVIEKYIAKS